MEMNKAVMDLPKRNIVPHVSIYTAEHPIDAEIRNTEVEYARPVTIGSDVWIGGNVSGQ